MYKKDFNWENHFENTLTKIGIDNVPKLVINKNNKQITENVIIKILSDIDIKYNVFDIETFRIALTHPTYIIKNYDLKSFKSILMGINFIKGQDIIPISEEEMQIAIPLGDTSYERLEFLGDSIIRLIISDYITRRYPEMMEGDLTKLRSQIENSSTLAEISRKIGLPKYMLISRNLEAIGARNKNNKYQCDILEAFIAALYYDSLGIRYKDIGSLNSHHFITNNIEDNIESIGYGYSLCYTFLIKLIENEIDFASLLETVNNYKDELLQLFHKLKWGDPEYKLMETILDENNKKRFKMYVRDNEGKIIGIGIGTSKQKGEKIAARKALQYLNIIPNDNDDIILNSNSDEIYFRNEDIKRENFINNNNLKIKLTDNKIYNKSILS